MSRFYLDLECKPEDVVNLLEYEIDYKENLLEDSDEFCEEYLHDCENKNEKYDSMEPTEWNMPFDKLEELMSPVTESGSIRKQVIRPGTGKVVPAESVVIIYIECYEVDQKTFDLTPLESEVKKFLTNAEKVRSIEDIAVQTMKKGEISRFLVNSDSECCTKSWSPTIQGNARTMYIFEVVNFFESNDASKFEAVPVEKLEKVPFENSFAVFLREHEVADDLFRDKYFLAAICCYLPMVCFLNNVSVANEAEDKQRISYQLKICLNLCLAYTNIKSYDEAITYGLLALHLDKNNPRAKYLLGCVLLLVDEFEKAKQYLLEAKMHEPFETCVNKVLLLFEQKRK